MDKPYRAIPFEEITAAWPQERRDRVAQRADALIAEDEAARKAAARKARAVRAGRSSVKTPHSA